MRTLVLALAILFAGCATSNRSGADTGLTEFQNESDEISQREQQCVKQAISRTNDRTVPIAAIPNAATGSQMQKAEDDRDRGILECKSIADREHAQLATRERRITRTKQSKHTIAPR
jgi:hypothetical protein